MDMNVSSTRTRGRPRQFDEEQVLDVLTTLFWQKGYESTSVADIARAAGLNKSSLYSTFGPKQELFVRILERYIDTRMAVLNELVIESGGGIEGVHTFLEFVRSEIGSDMGRHGCMAVNSAAELGSCDDHMVDLAVVFRNRMRETVRTLVAGAAEADELNAADVEHRTDMLTIFMMGLSVIMRSGADDAELNRFIDSAHADVDTWRG